MAVKMVRGLVPQRPIVRIVLLLAVAGMASGIAGAVFTGGETAARDPVTTRPAPGEAPPAPVPTVSEPPAPEQGPVEPPTPEPLPLEPPVPQPAAAPAETPAPSPADDPTPPAETAATTPPVPQPAAAPAETPAPSPADGPTPPAETAATTPPAAEQTPVAPPPPEAAAQLIEQLRPLVSAPDPNVPDYDRDHFAGWLDSDGDCVNTRHEILQVEAVDFSMNAEGCAVASGEWFDPYTDRTYTNPRDLDVDHVVALADAWVSGAWAWADELLDNFSNDFGNLNAIAAGENRSKSARGPADYSPTAAGARCQYLVQYATVKINWQLSITPQDFDVVATGLGGCEVGVVPDASPVAPDPRTATGTPTSTQPESDCHPAYEPCLPNLPGDALNCGDLRADQKPVTVRRSGEDPYRFDRDGDGRGCTS